MKPPKNAKALAEAGYYVLPLFNHQKAPKGQLGPNEGDGWGWLIGEGVRFCEARLTTWEGTTGYAISPAETDPVPLLVLDIDDHRGRGWEAVWSDLSDDPVPEGAGITETVNGGIHFYFRLPPGKKQLPRNGVDFGSGLRGDLFHSERPKSLIVLPGSQAVRKSDGRIAEYRAVRPIVPADLPEPPPGLWRRLISRKDAPAPAHPDKLPTELLHYLQAMRDYGPLQVPRGSINDFIARQAMLMGRIAPQAQPDEKIVNALMSVLGPGLEGFDPQDLTKNKEFRSAVRNGWARGQANKGQYDKRDANPTVSDVLAECRGQFGGEPWLLEFRRPCVGAGKTEYYLLGIGGTAKMPDPDAPTGRLESLTDRLLLAALERLSGANPDSVSSSPLMVQPNWLKILIHHLLSTRGVEYTTAAPEDLFIQGLRKEARTAMEAGYLVTRLSEKRDDADRSFVHWPVGDDDAAALVVPDPATQDALLWSSGDLVAAEKVRRKLVMVKALQGRSPKEKAWKIPLKTLAEDGNENLMQIGAAAVERLLSSRA